MVSGLVSKVPRPESRFWTVLERLRWLPLLFLVAVLGQCTAWMLDRSPPFRLLSYWTNQPKPGGTLVVRAKVQRDLDRECSVTFSRYLFDKVGARHEASGPQMMTPKALRNMDALAPGELNLQIPIPTNFPPGPAMLATVLEYRCNPLQDVLRPIGVELNMAFEVLS